MTDGSNGAGPLDGLRLIDFGQYLAGPFGPMILADLGMDVIKVEPATGDGMRMAGKPFFGCQRGKRDIALNVKAPEGRELALELVRRADAVHHNMTKGTATKLGIDYEACKTVKPDIVYCNTYAYGFEGPLSHFGGLDPLYQAAAGLEYEAGATQHGNDPLYYRFGMCDAANAMLSVVGVLAALLHRARTGEGQELWTSLLDGGAVFASDVMVKPDGTTFASAFRTCTNFSRPRSSSSTVITGITLSAAPRQRRRSRGTGSRANSGVQQSVWMESRSAAKSGSQPNQYSSVGKVNTILRSGVQLHTSTTRASPTRSRSIPRAATSCSSTPTTSASASSPTTSTRSWARCASSGTPSTSRTRRAGPTARRRV